MSASDLLREAGIAPEDYQHPAYSVLVDAARDIGRAEDLVCQRAAAIADRMALVCEKLDTGSSLNALGELQGAGVELDVAVAVREERLACWQRLVALAKHLDALQASLADLQSSGPVPWTGPAVADDDDLAITQRLEREHFDPGEEPEERWSE